VEEEFVSTIYRLILELDCYRLCLIILTRQLPGVTWQIRFASFSLYWMIVLRSGSRYLPRDSSRRRDYKEFSPR